jgi:hypothetical protein
MLLHSFLFAYFGPETVLPVTSVVATVLGIVMMFGKNTFRFILQWRKAERPTSQTHTAGQKPHFWQRTQARTPRS